MLLHKQESEEANGNKQTPHKNTPTIFLNKNLRPKKQIVKTIFKLALDWRSFNPRPCISAERAQSCSSTEVEAFFLTIKEKETSATEQAEALF